MSQIDSMFSILSRDLQADLFPYFDDLVSPLVAMTSRIINSGSEKPNDLSLDPEATGKIFECFSHLMRY